MADHDKDDIYNDELSADLPVDALNQLMHLLIDDVIKDLNDMTVKIGSHLDNTTKAEPS